MNLMSLFQSCVCGSGGALVDVGEAMKRLAEVKDSLDIDVKQNFIDPLQGLCDKDLREIQVQMCCLVTAQHTVCLMGKHYVETSSIIHYVLK